jgi:hypothetical protein
MLDWERRPPIYVSRQFTAGKNRVFTAINWRKITPDPQKLNLQQIMAAWNRVKDDVTGYATWDRVAGECRLPVERVAQTVKQFFIENPQSVSFNVNRMGDGVYLRFNKHET